jgi:hypothetical protein
MIVRDMKTASVMAQIPPIVPPTITLTCLVEEEVEGDEYVDGERDADVEWERGAVVDFERDADVEESEERDLEDDEREEELEEVLI